MLNRSCLIMHLVAFSAHLLIIFLFVTIGIFRFFKIFKIFLYKSVSSFAINQHIFNNPSKHIFFSKYSLFFEFCLVKTMCNNFPVITLYF